MFRLVFLFLCITTIYAALPVVREVHSVAVSDSKAANEEIVGTFSLVGDSLKTPFILQLVFENCNELKDRHNNSLNFTSYKLKYIKNQTMSWETINVPLTERGKNCIYNIEFYNDVQEKYDIELWASWDRKRATSGTFNGRVSFNILPKPKPLSPKKLLLPRPKPKP